MTAQSMNDPEVDQLKVYAIRNAAGEWMRSTGYGGYGPHWVSALSSAKFYTKLGQARARVTFWAQHQPVPPVIYVFTLLVKNAVVLDEPDRVAKAKKTKAVAEARQKRYWAKLELDDARDV